jgi:hypothetical protein
MGLLGGATVWPLTAPAQQPQRVRCIVILLLAGADDAEFWAWVGAFLQVLALLGWTIGRNVRIDIRWATANAAETRRHAAELAALAPDVILSDGPDLHELFRLAAGYVDRILNEQLWQRYLRHERLGVLPALERGRLKIPKGRPRRGNRVA